jgi:hypothetical protein
MVGRFNGYIGQARGFWETSARKRQLELLKQIHELKHKEKLEELDEHERKNLRANKQRRQEQFKRMQTVLEKKDQEAFNTIEDAADHSAKIRKEVKARTDLEMAQAELERNRTKAENAFKQRLDDSWAGKLMNRGKQMADYFIPEWMHPLGGIPKEAVKEIAKQATKQLVGKKKKKVAGAEGGGDAPVKKRSGEG